MKRIHHRPHDLGILGRYPGREQFPHARRAFHFLGRLARHQHELPSAMLTCGSDVNRRSRRIADLLRYFGQLHSVLQEDIDDQPELVEGVILEGRTDGIARETMRAVARDQVAPTKRRYAVRGEVARGCLGAFIGLRNRFDAGRQVNVYMREALHTRAQEALEVGLIKPKTAGPLAQVESGPFKEAKQSASSGVDEIYSGRRPYRRSDLVGEPEPAKEPHDLVVEMGRSWKMIDGSGLLDD